MAYYVIRDSSAVPTAVIEVEWGSAKAFTHDLEWVPSDLPGQAEECSYDESRQHLYAIVRHVRAHRQRTQWQGEYEYFVHLKYPDFVDTLKSPKALVRCRDGVRELLGPDGAWQATGDDPEGTLSVPISEAEHDRLRWEIAEPRWFVARDELPYPVAVVRRIPAVAEAYTRNLRWEPVPPGLALEAAGAHQAKDFQSKIETGVWLAGRPESVEYFAVQGWMSGPDLDHVYSVIRHENGVEEVYVRDGLWVRSNRLLQVFDLCRPLSADEVEQATARLSRSRCLVVEDGSDIARAVVHLDGGTERVFGHDLEWRTAGLLEEVADHPDWTVREITPGQEAFESYQLARGLRRFRQRHEWGGEAWYFGIYGTYRAALDPEATHLLVKTQVDDPWFGELYVGGGQWQPTEKLDKIWRGRSDNEELALSPAEAEAIMKRLG